MESILVFAAIPSISMEDVSYEGGCERIIDKSEIWWDVASVKVGEMADKIQITSEEDILV